MTQMSDHPFDTDFFRQLLLSRLDALDETAETAQDNAKVVELDQQSVGRLSRMDALQSQAMAQANLARRAHEEAKIQATLKRINEDEFGFCLECGDEIALGRLKLDPTVICCINCASGI